MNRYERYIRRPACNRFRAKLDSAYPESFLLLLRWFNLWAQQDWQRGGHHNRPCLTNLSIYTTVFERMGRLPRGRLVEIESVLPRHIHISAERQNIFWNKSKYKIHYIIFLIQNNIWTFLRVHKLFILGR